MVDPAIALLVAFALVAVALVLWWPQRGLLSHRRRQRQITARVLGEDALKHICSAEVSGSPPTLQSVAGTLSITVNRAAELLADLERRRLVDFAQGELRTTPDGRKVAMHIIRAHRLWERYLADKTGVSESEWHKQAERYEHTFSPEEASALSAELGNPSHDPHGDPIPTAAGELVPHGGQSLTALDVGEAARIVHIEDEPETLYAELVAEALHLGMEVRVIEKTSERVRFLADGDEHVLPPIVAHNVSVVPLSDAQAKESFAGERLSDLKLGQKARVVELSPACRGAERRRLLDLGFVPGTLAEVEMISPGGDPIAYRVRGTIIALRREQARLFRVQDVGEAVT